MRLTVESVVYFYILICVMLLLFNVIYITRSNRVKRRQERKVQQWKQALLEEFSRMPRPQADDAHQKLLARRLKSTEELMAYNEVLSTWQTNRRREVDCYFLLYRTTFRDLAVEYGKRSPMERAFFAYVIASFHPPVQGGYDMLNEILLGYFDNSTVYCRENVLGALYALGSEQAVEHAFEILHERGWYHHPRLLSDGMAKFAGDRAALALRLWRHRRQWPDFLSVAAVQLAAALPGDAFSQPFLEGLLQEGLPVEVQFALVRYFGRHYCAGAGPALLGMLEERGGADGGLAVAAATSLARYPGEDTMRALKGALHSRNWYVRHNAAVSLAALGITREETEEIRASGDRYAIEMLEYMTGTGPEEPAPQTEGERVVTAV